VSRLVCAAALGSRLAQRWAQAPEAALGLRLRQGRAQARAPWVVWLEMLLLAVVSGRNRLAVSAGSLCSAALPGEAQGWPGRMRWRRKVQGVRSAARPPGAAASARVGVRAVVVGQR
jgi:hypothetical protein